MIARLVALFIDDIRRELARLEHTPPEDVALIHVATLDTEPADQPEANELRSGFTT